MDSWETMPPLQTSRTGVGVGVLAGMLKTIILDPELHSPNHALIREPQTPNPKFPIFGEYVGNLAIVQYTNSS